MVKKIFVALTFTLALSSGAFATNYPILTRIQSNGSISPKYRTTQTCVINTQVVEHFLTDIYGKHTPNGHDFTKWTKEIPNEKTLLKLLGKASTGQILRIKTPIRPGSPMFTYGGVFKAPQNNKRVEVQLKRTFVYVNNSAATPVLSRFIDHNCVVDATCGYGTDDADCNNCPDWNNNCSAARK